MNLVFLGLACCLVSSVWILFLIRTKTEELAAAVPPVVAGSFEFNSAWSTPTSPSTAAFLLGLVGLVLLLSGSLWSLAKILHGRFTA
jgi:hypothetical protein